MGAANLPPMRGDILSTIKILIGLFTSSIGLLLVGEINLQGRRKVRDLLNYFRVDSSLLQIMNQHWE